MIAIKLHYGRKDMIVDWLWLASVVSMTYGSIDGNHSKKCQQKLTFFFFAFSVECKKRRDYDAVRRSFARIIDDDDDRLFQET